MSKGQKKKKKQPSMGNEVAFSWGAAIGSCFLLLLPLIIGWLMMMNHLEAGSYGEEKLAEPFYKWIHSFSKVYWLTGAVMVCGWLIGVKSINDSEKQGRRAMPFLGMTIVLLGIGFTVAYIIALIKLNAAIWSILFAILLIIVMIGQTAAVFWKKSWLRPLTWKAMIGFWFLSVLLLIIADHSEGLYTVVRRGGAMGNFSLKLLLWSISALGTGLMIGMYEFVLRKLTKN